jgi:hypothetical protein
MGFQPGFPPFFFTINSNFICKLREFEEICKRLYECEEIEMSRQSYRGDCEWQLARRKILKTFVCISSKNSASSFLIPDVHAYTLTIKRGVSTAVQGVTKTCRLSWVTNSALVYEPKCGGREGGSCGISASTAEYMEPK